MLFMLKLAAVLAVGTFFAFRSIRTRTEKSGYTMYGSAPVPFLDVTPR